VVYFNETGQLVHQPAKIIVLAASATETPRLLLNSRSRWFPRGMVNRNDWVGRNLMGHIGPSVIGIFEETTNTGLGPGPGVAIDDFYGKIPGIVGGGVIYSRTETMPGAFSESRPPDSSRWGLSHKVFQRKYFRRMVRLWVPGEDMPVYENRVEVSPTLKDHWGIPVCRITHGFHPYDFRLFDFFRPKMEQLMQEAGATRVWSSTAGPGGIGSHQNGTCRMGKDPQSSVVNRHGQSHEADNLFITDGSLFVTSGGRNPALTINALAYWVSAFIIKEWQGGAWRNSS
jgi:choline dehydrogenase-like flavoprotein